MGAEYWDQPVCNTNVMSVCLCVCLLVYLKKPHIPTSRNFVYMLAAVVARSSSDDSVICYVLLVLWMTSCLLIITQAKATTRGRILKVTHQGQQRGRSLMSTTALLISIKMN